MKKNLALVLPILLAIIFFGSSCQTENIGTFSPFVDSSGGISLPKTYRTEWLYLGSWVVADEKSPGYGYHDVFTQPSSIEAYRKTGKFPDGAVLVKEIRKVNSAAMTTGRQVNYAGNILSWFVMIKDHQGRFPDNPNWGDGWGWGLYEATNPDKNVSTNYKKDCIPCHIPAKTTDWVYVEGYPSLKKTVFADPQILLN